MRRFRKTIRDPSSFGKKKKSRSHFDVTMDLHGFTAEEALAEVKDEIFSSDSESILIIHGKGDGVLRRRIRAFLSSCGDVRKVEFGENVGIQGGEGVTAVYI